MVERVFLLCKLVHKRVDAYPVERACAGFVAVVIVLHLVVTPPALAVMVLQIFKNCLATGRAKSKISGHARREVFALVVNYAVDIPKTNPQQARKKALRQWR